jgi:hypothetical protein
LIAPGIFGIREINEVLRLFSNLPLAWKSLKTFIISTLNTYQQAWKNAIEKPSGPDALKPTIPFTTFLSFSPTNNPQTPKWSQGKDHPPTVSNNTAW